MNPDAASVELLRGLSKRSLCSSGPSQSNDSDSWRGGDLFSSCNQSKNDPYGEHEDTGLEELKMAISPHIYYTAELPIPLISGQILVPKHRKPLEEANIDEAVAVAALTSLSTSPAIMCLNSGTTRSVCKESIAMSSSYSSSTTSSHWSWDMSSDQSIPSTPSPPLPTEVTKNLCSSFQFDDCIDDAEMTHFLFDEAVPRKRKNSGKVMFRCLWKNCGKVLSTASGMKRHIRTMHLSHDGDSDHSDGEEDFYYTEVAANLDSLIDGLSSLTPASPTSSVPLPAFPINEVPKTDMVAISTAIELVTPLSQSAPTKLCHIKADHAYQAAVPFSFPVSSQFVPSMNRISISWQSPTVIVRGSPGSFGIGEKYPQLTHTADIKAQEIVSHVPKLTAGTRKSRGEAKKCRKVYGMDNRDMWCTACRWKKACQRFLD
ncbi:zinc finger protein 704-like [Protopterus annectens]|uniref:zinc finger protein 704-like n=1 Tax=Protopterus annectens TaxID=7888 RepID=UPI001CF9E8FC|nr:zinc finger protein 704-like [Protopterus annectens]